MAGLQESEKIIAHVLIHDSYSQRYIRNFIDWAVAIAPKGTAWPAPNSLLFEAVLVARS